jgi:hypothetical protein
MDSLIFFSNGDIIRPPLPGIKVIGMNSTGMSSIGLIVPAFNTETS